jgi:hypothetical protein
MEGVMARAKKAAGVGHNSAELTDDDRSSLYLRHRTDIRILEKKRAELKALMDGVAQQISGKHGLVKSDLGFTRKQTEEVLLLENMTEAEFRASEGKRTARLVIAGLPVGTQLDMFASDTVDDKAEAFANGRRAAYRGEDAVPAEGIHPMFHTDWMGGYQEAQAEFIMKLGRADGLIASRAMKPKAGEMVADAEDEGDGDEIDLEDEVAAQMKALKDSGWAADAPTPPKLEEANGGKTVRAPKGRSNAEARTFADPGLEPVY